MYKARRICYLVKRVTRCRITDFVDANSADLASPKEQKESLLIFGRGFAGSLNRNPPLALTSNVRSSEHRLLRERLRPTCLSACLSRIPEDDLATLRDATDISAASLRGCRSTFSRWAQARATLGTGMRTTFNHSAEMRYV